jgi:hypothetical protein
MPDCSSNGLPKFMNLGPETGTSTVTRDALYEQVWAKPFTRLAEKYGVSDTALANICRKLNIPVPGRGYWAKVAAGHQVKKSPLPRTAKLAQAVIRPRKGPNSAYPHPLTAKTRRYFADVHRRVATAAKRLPGEPCDLRDAPPHDEHGRYRCPTGDGFPVVLSLAEVERALRLLDSLVKALVKEGFRFDVHKANERAPQCLSIRGLVAVKEGEQLGFSLREGYNRRERTGKELLDARNDHRYVLRVEDVPNGGFTFELVGDEAGINEIFRDDRKGKLESELGRIVATFVDAVPRQKILRAEREAVEQARQEQERQTSLERDRVRREKELLEAVLGEAENARRFGILKSYLEQLDQGVLRGGAISAEGAQWLSRVRALVATYDPADKRLSMLRRRGVADPDTKL